MKTITIENSHICAGESRPSKCPIALALIDAGYPRPHVTRQQIRITDEEYNDHYYPTPPEARKFIDAFDREWQFGKDVRPFSFEFEAV